MLRSHLLIGVCSTLAYCLRKRRGMKNGVDFAELFSAECTRISPRVRLHARARVRSASSTARACKHLARKSSGRLFGAEKESGEREREREKKKRKREKDERQTDGAGRENEEIKPYTIVTKRRRPTSLLGGLVSARRIVKRTTSFALARFVRSMCT